MDKEEQKFLFAKEILLALAPRLSISSDDDDAESDMVRFKFMAKCSKLLAEALFFEFEEKIEIENDQT